MNKPEQFSSDDHLMSLAGVSISKGVGMYKGWVCTRGGYVHGGIPEWVGCVCPVQRGYSLPCEISHDVCNVTSPLVDRHMPVKSLPSFTEGQLRRSSGRLSLQKRSVLCQRPISYTLIKLLPCSRSMA